jgi:hypothetical protein
MEVGQSSRSVTNAVSSLPLERIVMLTRIDARQRCYRWGIAREFIVAIEYVRQDTGGSDPL